MKRLAAAVAGVLFALCAAAAPTPPNPLICKGWAINAALTATARDKGIPEAEAQHQVDVVFEECKAASADCVYQLDDAETFHQMVHLVYLSKQSPDQLYKNTLEVCNRAIIQGKSS